MGSAPQTAPYSPPRSTPPLADIAAAFPQLEILELLGKGGMGAVYKARQPHLDRFIALKVLPPDIGRDPAFAERFAREARALGRLNHANIVAVHDFGQADGLYWLSMEFVDGVNLRQAMRAGQLTPEQALRIVPQLCDALQFAHDEGVVHRDIKPENILLDRRGRVKVADFGLAKLLGQSAADTGLTGTQQVMGTQNYMAPEQLAGARTVDHRADIFSLGVTFYEMLTGDLPLGHFPLPSHKPGIDARLDHVVLRTLEREPDHRYQHASEVKTDIESISHAPAATVGLRATANAAGIVAQPRYAHWVGIPTAVLVGLFVLLGIGMCMLGNLHLISIPLAPEEPNARIFGGRPTATTLWWVGVILGTALVLVVVAFAVLNLLWVYRGYLMDARDNDVRHRIQRAGRWLLAVGIVTLLSCPLTPIILRLLGDVLGQSTAWDSPYGKFVIVTNFVQAGWSLVAGVAITCGGLAMRRVQSPGMGIIASGLAVVPLGVGVVLGLPVGIWCLILMSRREVRNEFQRAAWLAKSGEAGATPSRVSSAGEVQTAVHSAEMKLIDQGSKLRAEIRRAGTGLLVIGILVLVAWFPVNVALWNVGRTYGFINMPASLGVALWINNLGCLIAAPLIIGCALEMRRIRARGQAILAAILMLLPVTVTFPLGVPVGIWCLMLLCRPDVRDEFQRTARGTNREQG
jgi:predicted Ser/Thr protein kinase